MTFSFSLQKILDYRCGIEKECRARLEQAIAVREKLREMLSREREEYFIERDELNAVVCKAEFSKVPLYEMSLEARKRRMLEILENTRDAEQEVANAEAILLQARKNLKAIENLRERKLLEFNRREEAAERKFFDDLGTQRHNRREEIEVEKVSE